MAEQVFGLGVNQVMAYAAVATVLLVVVLAGINVYYAVHAKRQADASREQVAVFTRQAEIAAETLSFLRKQIDQQVRTDVAAVALQLKVAIHVIEDWLKRTSSSESHPQLPDQISILPTEFSLATQRAHSIDPIAAENMGAAALYVSEAETNLKILRGVTPGSQTAKEVHERAAKSLNAARYKLSVARTRWEALEAPAS